MILFNCTRFIFSLFNEFSLNRAGQQGWSFVDLLADFHLLLFISDFFGPQDMPIICASITNRDEPLSEGYQLLLRSIAGIDG